MTPRRAAVTILRAGAANPAANEDEHMGYIVIARKYRPRRFEEVAGQEGAATTLRNAISGGRIGHAYLFAGPRGVGKTSMARILSMSLNCAEGPTETPCGKCRSCMDIHLGRDMDVMEIDGASNRGIDEIRAIRENAAYSPSKSRFRIFIIDEVHMLTIQAFNALLKILEEPPEHVKFILATTKPQSIPDTIRSRCQRFDFRPVTQGVIRRQLEGILKSEGAEAEDGVLDAVARRAGGSMRDSQSLLDQLLSMGGRITLKSLEQLLGWIPLDEIRKAVSAFAASDLMGALECVERMHEEGRDPAEFMLRLEEYARDLLLFKAAGGSLPVPSASGAGPEDLAGHAEAFDRDMLIYMIQVVHGVRKELSRDLEGRLILEAAFARLAAVRELEPIGRAIEAAEVPAAEHEPAPGTPRPPEAPAPPASPAAKADAVKSAWPEVLARLKKKHTWAAYLVDAAIARVDESGLVLGFPEDRGLHKAQASRQDRKDEISRVIREVAGVEVRVSCSTVGGKAGNAFDGVSEDKADRGAKRGRDAEDSPAVRSALRVFEGKVVPRDEAK